jgi:ABC-type phosphate/phosphonate transport system ATPase subunit
VDAFSHRTINLEKGMPLVQQALDRLEVAIKTGSEQGFKALTFIHGYGSSGAGGAIKTAVLRQLQFLIHQGRVKAIIPGEEFEGRSGRGRQLLRQFPFLMNHRDLNRANPGITLVIL